MRNKRPAAFFVALLAAAALFAQQQTTTISKKQDVAVFAIGYTGYDIPLETIASVDSSIFGVFVNLGRFNVFGQTQRLAAGDVQSFIDTLKRAKEANFVLPEEYKFGDKQMTEADFNKLVGAFVVVVPTIVDFNSTFNDSQKQYETTIKTSVAFIDVANGTTFGYANINTSGTSKETQYKSIQQALSGIASQLTFEVRKISAFTLNTQILTFSSSEVKLQFGRDMGVVVGDEYAIIEKSVVAGFADEREDGLIVIKNVGSQISTGTILYAGKTLQQGAQLREIPRLGFDAAAYLSYLNYVAPVAGKAGAIEGGVRAVATRGFYNVRPFAGVQIIADSDLYFPVSAYAGVEWSMMIRRLSLYGYGAAGAASNVVLKALETTVETTTDTADDEDWVSHYGLKAGAGASFLITRDMKIYAEAGAEYWFGVLSGLGTAWDNYGGAGLGIGVVLKL